MITGSSQLSRRSDTDRSPGLVESIRERMQTELRQPVFQRDPDYIARQLPRLERIVRYFRPSVSGFHHAPLGGPFLLVGNHCGGVYTPEMYAFAAAWLRHFGVEAPIYGLGHNILFASPMSGFFRKMGAIPASFDNAEQAFDRGAPVMVYPGGDYEAFRPWWHRNRIDFGGRKGFVRLALRRQVPVVPVVTHGSHESTFVVARGDRLARLMGLERVNVKIFPFILGMPWGLIPGWVPHLPMPSKIRIELGAALDWSHYGPEAAEDPAIVDRCYAEITSVMQTRLDRMVRENPYPLFS